MTYSDKSFYVGEWKDQLMHGYGAKYTKDMVLVYNGEWNEGKECDY